MEKKKEKIKKHEQTLVLIKPDGIAKSLTGNIITTLSDSGLRIVGAKIVKVPKELAEQHYKEHKGKEFFENLIEFIMGKTYKGDDPDRGRVLALVYQGENAIKRIREKCGLTHPEKAHPTSIRGKYGRINSKTGVLENVVHASDSAKSAEHEIKIWFKPEELVETIFPVNKIKKEIEHITWL